MEAALQVLWKQPYRFAALLFFIMISAFVSYSFLFNIYLVVFFQMPTMLENASKFSQLKYLMLELTMHYKGTGNILYLASYLRAAPVVEKLEVHVSTIFSFLSLDFFLFYMFAVVIFSVLLSS